MYVWRRLLRASWATNSVCVCLLAQGLRGLCRPPITRAGGSGDQGSAGRIMRGHDLRVRSDQCQWPWLHLATPPFLRKSAMWFRWHLLWCQWPHLSYWNQRQEHQKINRKVPSGKYMSNRINKKDKSIYISPFQYFSEKTVWKDCFLVMFPSGKHINMPFRQTSTAPCRHISCATERQRVGKTIACSACRGSGVGEHIYIYLFIYKFYIHIHDDIFILYIYTYVIVMHFTFRAF